MDFLTKCLGGSASAKQPSATIQEFCQRFSLSQLRQATDNFHESQMIGQGSLLVSLVGFCDQKNEMIMVYEYMPNASLYDKLHRRDSNSPSLSWKKRLEISIGVARVLHYLHVGTKRTVIHLAIKSSNILLDENWIPKLTDFRLSLKGPKYSSNEKAKEGMVSDKCDVYNFGVILLELICGKGQNYMMEIIHLAKSTDEGSEDQKGGNKDEDEPYWSLEKAVRRLVEKGSLEKIIDANIGGEIATECCKLYMEIVLSCMSEDPDERPHMGQVEVELS
ncbi:receptor-like protein kinase ANXUR2 [Prosopis cineraria]|uniref:receptor-like protein kinase ANXUR2 n=1 Tax=Prosopis cineraria TaxID=364024 RepID=UPI00240FEF66|nr:receptor-like protein kinase ANXUR2 [Prosopis cineraria]